MASQAHRLRRELRAALAGHRRLVGTFVKLPAVDVVEMCALAGFDFVVVDLEHSALSEQDAIGLVRHADVCGLPALVRVPAVDAPALNRLLENGAAGIQLSMLQTRTQGGALRNAVRYPPEGRRSVSLANRTGLGAGGLAAYLAAEAADPPLLVGQIETAGTEPLGELLPGLDVCFVGGTDLSVDLGVAAGDRRLREAVDAIRAASRRAGVVFGGWAPSISAVAGAGLDGADYLVVGSDVQILAAGLRAASQAKE
jgi:4-hydroxy-2-oxoheptanedioate aldolase